MDERYYEEDTDNDGNPDIIYLTSGDYVEVTKMRLYNSNGLNTLLTVYDKESDMEAMALIRPEEAVKLIGKLKDWLDFIEATETPYQTPSGKEADQ